MSERPLVSGGFVGSQNPQPRKKTTRGEILQRCGSRAASRVRHDDLAHIPAQENWLLMLPSSWMSTGLVILLTGGDRNKRINKEEKSTFTYTTNQKLHVIAFVSSAIWRSSSLPWSPTAAAAEASKLGLDEGLQLFVLSLFFSLFILFDCLFSVFLLLPTEKHWASLEV